MEIFWEYSTGFDDSKKKDDYTRTRRGILLKKKNKRKTASTTCSTVTLPHNFAGLYLLCCSGAAGVSDRDCKNPLCNTRWRSSCLTSHSSCRISAARVATTTAVFARTFNTILFCLYIKVVSSLAQPWIFNNKNILFFYIIFANVEIRSSYYYYYTTTYFRSDQVAPQRADALSFLSRTQKVHPTTLSF